MNLDDSMFVAAGFSYCTFVCVCVCMREAERALSDMTSGSKYILFLLIFSILDLRLNASVDDL